MISQLQSLNPNALAVVKIRVSIIDKPTGIIAKNIQSGILSSNEGETEAPPSFEILTELDEFTYHVLVWILPISFADT